MAVDFTTFKAKHLVFDPPKTNNYGGQRINIRYDGPGYKGKCSISTPCLFSWGVQQNNYEGEGNAMNYSMSLVMHKTDEPPTAEETVFMEVVKQITRACQAHLKKEDVKEVMNKWDMDHLVDAINPWYVKKEKGVPVPGKPPTLYPRLFTSFEHPQAITTFFFTIKKGKEVTCPPPKTRCTVVCGLLVDSIYIGAKPSIVYKLQDVCVVEKLSEVRRQLTIDKLPKWALDRMAARDDEASEDEEDKDEEEDQTEEDDQDSADDQKTVYEEDTDEEEEEEQEQQQQPVKRPVKRPVFKPAACPKKVRVC